MRVTLWTLGGMASAAFTRQMLRYGAASVGTAVLGQVVLITAFGVLHWSAGDAAVTSFVVAALASYHVNRAWVWGRSGRSHLVREVLPFCAVFAIGLALSTAMIVLAEQQVASATDSHAARTTAVLVASWGSVVAVWAIKYLVLDRYVFVARVAVGSEVSGGRVAPEADGLVPARRFRG